MKKIWLALIGLFLIQYKSYAFTNYLECTGFDGLGQKVNANIYCSQGCKKVTAYINGDKFTAVGETKDSQGFVTKKFVTTQGVYVYDSVVFSKKKLSLNIYQFNAATNALVAKAPLSCHIVNDSANHNIESRQIDMARRK